MKRLLKWLQYYYRGEGRIIIYDDGSGHTERNNGVEWEYDIRFDSPIELLSITRNED